MKVIMKKIIKIIVSVCMLFVLLFTLSACGNRDMFDTVYTYDYAIVGFPDGTSKKIEIKQWRDYEDGEQIQIKDKNGNTYLVNSVNCVLVQE